MIAVDTETTGISFEHGCKPFFVTICDDKGEQTYWEWDVDPLTRQPIIPQNELEEVADMFAYHDEFVFQNPKFDIRGLRTVMNRDDIPTWERIYDTLLAGHLLASAEPHTLKDMAIIYLKVEIGKYENELGDICKKARSIARRKYPDWRIAKEGDPCLPTVKKSSNNKTDKKWKNDMWLPRAIAKAEGYDKDHPWWTVLADYANADAAVTLPLYEAMMEHIESRDLGPIYQERLKLLDSVDMMEKRGVTINVDRLEEMHSQFTEEVERSNKVGVRITSGKMEKYPKGRSKILNEVMFDDLKLPVIKKTKKGAPAADKFVIEDWLLTLPQQSQQHLFVRHLKSSRKRNTALGYMDSYLKFGKQIDGPWWRLWPNFNTTGADTLRFSSQWPNAQQISKQDGFNLRYIFGPTPGRVWYSLDYKNIEMRIPAYEAGEQAIIDLMERPNEAPYYGSFHLLVCDILHPEKFAQCLKDGRIVQRQIQSNLVSVDQER